MEAHGFLYVIAKSNDKVNIHLLKNSELTHE